MDSHPEARAAAVDASLIGKVAVLINSTSGIPLSVARALAAAGADVVLTGFGPPDEIARTVTDLHAEFGVSAHHSQPISGACRDRGAGGNDARTYGRLDILVNNAGIQAVAPLDHVPVATLDRIFAVKLSAAVHATRHALRHAARGRCRVINLAPAHGRWQHALRRRVRRRDRRRDRPTQATALATDGEAITCNVICPSTYWVPPAEIGSSRRARERGSSVRGSSPDVMPPQRASGRTDVAGEVGELAAFLASDAAASITGAVLSSGDRRTAR
jgi:3-hydroxybutyrate dehydrogenase